MFSSWCLMKYEFEQNKLHACHVSPVWESKHFSLNVNYVNKLFGLSRVTPISRESCVPINF